MTKLSKVLNSGKNVSLSKHTIKKKTFADFVDGGYSDLELFYKACKNDENLMIYTCITPEELQEYIEKIKDLDSLDKKLKYLKENQPAMNTSPERYESCVLSIAKYLKGYIEFNGYKLANLDGDAEDWTSEFWLKYAKICRFYKTRWFFPETLKRSSTVVYSPVLYKEFIYICRMSITGERKHKAFLAALNQSSSLYKCSLDNTLDNANGKDGENKKTLADIIPLEEDVAEASLDKINLEVVIERAVSLIKQYPDIAEHCDKIKEFYNTQETGILDKKLLIVSKIFLYKAGLTSPKVINFVSNLPSVYKSKYNINVARLNNQQRKYAQTKTNDNICKTKGENSNKKTWRELIFRKRGEI